jgi:uncharacterized protein (TIGR03083 family)
VEPLSPIHTAQLFPPLHAELIRLLRNLDPRDWERPTPAPRWRVRDVASHLLDGDLRKLSFGRDNHQLGTEPPSSFGDIVALINGLNASGVQYATRLSARVMTDLLEISGGWVSEYVASLPPHGKARFAVAWAGEDESENWLDTGREYTERWHHQMQIREAVGVRGLLEPPWLHPLLDLSVRAFRRTYQAVVAAEGTAVVFEVDGDGQSAWSVVRGSSAWSVMRGRAPDAAASLRADADTAWKLLYNALSPELARARVVVTGDRSLAEPMLGARSVMVSGPEDR